MSKHPPAIEAILEPIRQFKRANGMAHPDYVIADPDIFTAYWEELDPEDRFVKRSLFDEAPQHLRLATEDGVAIWCDTVVVCSEFRGHVAPEAGVRCLINA